LTQLHFLSSKPILVTCKLCDLSYTRGAPEDEELHRTHCLRVVRGMEWSREERTLEKPIGSGASDVELVEERCVLPNGVVGRIVRIRCDVTKGKLGQKVSLLYPLTVGLV
jgi:N-acetyltransferase